MNKELTQNEYLQAQGLFALARRAVQEIEKCEKAYIALVQYPHNLSSIDAGRFTDKIWESNSSLDEILDLEGIKVKKQICKK